MHRAPSHFSRLPLGGWAEDGQSARHPEPVPEESSEDELPPQIHKVGEEAVADRGNTCSGCQAAGQLPAPLRCHIPSLSCRYSLAYWGSRGGCRLGAAWAAGCGVSPIPLLSQGDRVAMGSILLPSIADETKLPGQQLSSRVSSQRHSDCCGVNACVSTYMCLCSHLCRPCRRIAAEPVTADGTGSGELWMGSEAAAAAAV